MKKFLGIVLCCAICASASMIGIDALGEEQTIGGSAGAAGRGFAGGAKTGEAEGFLVTNPARMAFDTKVVVRSSRRLVSRSFQKPSAVVAPVFVLIITSLRRPSKARPSFSSLSV